MNNGKKQGWKYANTITVDGCNGWHCLIQHYVNKPISNTISDTMHHCFIRKRRSLEYLLRVNDLQLASVFSCSRHLRLLLTFTSYYLVVVVSILTYSFVAMVVFLCCDGSFLVLRGCCRTFITPFTLAFLSPVHWHWPSSCACLDALTFLSLLCLVTLTLLIGPVYHIHSACIYDPGVKMQW